MYRTIVTSSHISVQGEFVKRLPDGREVVRVGDAEYVGMPVSPLPRKVVAFQAGATSAA
ncbi:hypothetical protein HMH01_02160 [Halovulum dunhuangense]|uniref:Uncharacterized protein n=1 Tax=Halovulum dunhuangense TaxID=1505036 RepID=A0A849KZ47_9RHOB|nr:hypothetical protein [Halovulum dunhuangense]NNU79232.1 hypothetical protein [Halovulum dunhuangense]